MTRSAFEANRFENGFHACASRSLAARRTHAFVATLMAGVLTLATVIAVAIVSIEVVTAAAL